MLDDHMKKLQKEMELTQPLNTDLPGVYALPLEEGLTVIVTSMGSGCVLTCNMIACPKQREEDFYSTALLGDLFGQGTGGAVLGLSEDGNMLTLSKAIDYNIEYKDFKDLLEDFINSVDFWRQEVLNHNAKAGQLKP